MYNMMKTYMDSYLMKFVKNEEGQGMAEYGLILAVVAVIVVVAIALLGTNLTTFFTTLAGKFTPAPTPPAQ